MTTPALDHPPTARDGRRLAPYESRDDVRRCESCGRDTRHLVTDCYAADGTHRDSFDRCLECPPEQLTAWVVHTGMLREVIVADDQNVAVANRPLAHGNRGPRSADYALAALGFERVSAWTSTDGADTCQVQWR